MGSTCIEFTSDLSIGKLGESNAYWLMISGAIRINAMRPYNLNHKYLLRIVFFDDIWFSLPASHKLLQSQFSVVECLTLAVKFYITILFFMSSNFTIMSDLNIYSISSYFDLNIHSIFFVLCWVDLGKYICISCISLLSYLV